MHRSEGNGTRKSKQKRNLTDDAVGYQKGRKTKKNQPAQLVPVVVVSASTAVFVVFLAVLEIALGVVIVGHVVIFVFVKLVVFEFLDFVVFGILLFGLLVLGFVLCLVGVVKVGELVASRLGVDLEGLPLRVGVLALALRVNNVPELFREMFLLCTSKKG